MNNDYSASELVVNDLADLLHNARSFKDDAITLKSQNPITTQSFYVLTTMAFELYLKVLLGYKICLTHTDNACITQEEVKNEIMKMMRSHVHKLDGLFEQLPDLKNHLGISEISEFKENNVWEYRIMLKSGEHVIVKELQAIRYGVFAINSNMATWAYSDQAITAMLNKLDEFVKSKAKETYNKIIK